MSGKIWILAGVLLGLIAPGSLEGTELRLEEKSDKIMVENDFIRMEIVSAGGGISSLYDKKANRDWTSLGFCADRVWEKNQSNESRSARHTLRVIKQSKDIITVETYYQGQKGLIKGVDIIKRYSLKKDECRVEVEFRIVPRKNPAIFSPWLWNVFQLPEDFKDNDNTYVYCQMEKGLYCQAPSKAEDTSILFDPKEPWIGMVCQRSKTGMAQILRKNDLNHFYCWMGDGKLATLEPVFAPIDLSIDASWQTELFFIPTTGLRSCHFASDSYVGGFSEQDGKAILCFFPAVNLGQTSLKISSQNNTISQQSFVGVAGKTIEVPVDLKQGMHTLEINVKTADKEYKHCIRAATKTMPSEVQPAKNIGAERTDQPNMAYLYNVKKCLYVSPDMPTIMVFGMRHTLTNGTEVEFTYEFPKGINVDFSSKEGVYQSSFHTTLTRREDFLLNEKPYTRFVTKKTIANSRDLSLQFFVTSDWKAGKCGDAYYYARHSGGAQEKVKIPVVSVAIGSAPVPKRLIAGLGWQYMDLRQAWPNFYENQKRLGMNTVTVMNDDLAKPERFAEAVKCAGEQGLWVAMNQRNFFPSLKDTRNAKAIDLSGKETSQMCPSYRGKAFQDYVEYITDCARGGVSMLWYDIEMWHGDICFCERCVAGFSKYIRGKHPDIPYVNPREFEIDPGKNKNLHNIWEEFKCSLGAEMFGIVQKRFYEKIAQFKAKSSPFPVLGFYRIAMPGSVMSNFLRFDELSANHALNVSMPSLYVAGDARRVGDAIMKIRKSLGSSMIISYLSAGWGTRSSECEGIEVKYMVLENFLNGAMGFSIYEWGGVDGMDMKYLAEAMRMVVPVEDIIVDGTVADDIESSNKDVTACGLRHGQELLILVSEYVKADLTKTAVVFPAESPAMVIDMATLKKVGTVSKASNKIEVTLEKERAKLFYIGNRRF